MRSLFLCLLLLPSIVHAQWTSWWQVEATQLISSSSDIEAKDVAWRRLALRPSWVSEWNDDWEISAAAQLELESDGEHHVEWRDSHLSYYGEDHVWRVGRQMIAWGRMDGLRMGNRINPLDMRRYPQPYSQDTEEGVLHVGALSLEQFFPSFSLQWLLVPEYRQSTLADNDNPLSPLYPLRDLPILDEGPPSSPEFGVKASMAVMGGELDFYFWQGYPDLPLYIPLLDEDASPQALEVHYARERYLGMGYALSDAGRIWRAELGYLPDLRQAMNTPARDDLQGLSTYRSQQGLETVEQLSAALGIELEPADRWRLLLQGMGQWRRGSVAGTQSEAHWQLSLSRPFGLRDEQRLKLDLDYRSDEASLLAQLEYRHQLNDRWRLLATLIELKGDGQSRYANSSHRRFSIALRRHH